MTIVNILQYNRFKADEKGVLTTEANEVSDFNEAILKTVEDLRDTLHSQRIAVGLAAPQIGVPLKITIINLKTEGFADLAMINPKIIQESGKKKKLKESCMSLPNLRGEVERRSKIEVNYQNEFGEQKTVQAEGFLARVIAHEVDHLNGVLYSHRIAVGSSLEKVDFKDLETKITNG